MLTEYMDILRFSVDDKKNFGRVLLWIINYRLFHLNLISDFIKNRYLFRKQIWGLDRQSSDKGYSWLKQHVCILW